MSDPTDTMIHAVNITSAWLSNNPIATADVSLLLLDVHRALTGCVAPAVAAPVPEAPTASTPAVPVRRSVFPDHLVCLDCGASMRTLLKHLRQTHRIEPEVYRAKWDLPGSYPLVAPDYTVVRSGMAKASGLGRRRG